MKTKTFGWVMGLAAAVAAATAQAEGWRFSAGPAWRSRVEVKTSGSVSAPPDVAAGSYTTAYTYDMSDRVAVPDTSSGASPGDTLWSVGATRTETVRVPGACRADFSDADNSDALGFNLAASYDFFSGETLSFGLGLRLAAFFGMEASSSRFLDTGSTRTVVTFGRSLLETPFPPTPPAAPPPPADRDSLFIPGSSAPSVTTVPGAGSRRVRTRYRADLWQLGVGPNVTWHALSWLDAYAGAEAILNLVAADFDANRASDSRTDCRLGFGGHVGLEAKLTDNLGLYGQVGYEWVDASDVSAGGLRAEADFSSLVVSAGVCFRF